MNDARKDACPEVTVFILTYNEEANLPHALDTVCGWAHAVYVVDSYSSDRTLAIAAEYGVQVHQNEWENWAVQRNWAMDNIPIETPWVLWLDADELITPPLAAEIAQTLPNAPASIVGYYTNRTRTFMGRILKHGGYAPNYVLRLTRPEATRIIPAGDREYVHLDGETARLTGMMHHEDQRGINFWIAKHNRISDMAAVYRLDQNAQRNLHQQAGNLEGRWRNRIRDKVLMRLPFWLEPLIFFVYRYFFKLGFLDGKEGLYYCFFQAFWYPFLVAAKTHELRKRGMKDEG